MNETESQEIKIRGMAPADLGAVLALDELVCGKKKYSRYVELAGDDPARKLDYCFVAIDKGGLIGFLIAVPVYLYAPHVQICSITGFIIHPDYRQQGVSIKLLRELVDKCVLMDIKTIRGLVDETDKDLVVIVEKLGFKRSNFTNYDIILRK